MAFQQGLSGLNATSKNLSIIGNNIANANTYGAKASRAEFADMYANAINGAGGSPIGIGVNLASVTQRFTQGNITTTESGLDLAINGNGFFMLDAGNGSKVYSRNGQLQLNEAGFIVNSAGQKLLGLAQGNTNGTDPVPVRLPTGGIQPQATTSIEMEMNLDSRVGPPATTPFDFTDSTSYNNATSTTVYDSNGREISLALYYVNVAPNVWDVYATANGTDFNAGAPIVDDLTMLSDGSGIDTGVSALLNSFAIPAIPLGNGNSTEPIANIDLDLTGATQYGSPFGVTNLNPDGYAYGTLIGVNIDKNGIIKATYSNGESQEAGQLLLANFRNPQGLQPLGGNGWAETYASGNPLRTKPGEGNAGLLQSGALEESNVDLTAELVSMITAQRSYQANAQSIKTEDQVLQTLVNLR